MSDAMDAWTNPDGEKPAEPGWYPVLCTWAPEEGTFPTAHWWTGKAWVADPGDPGLVTHAHVLWMLHRCETQEEAEALAQANDPDQ
jgi:hypothetical protein